MKRGFLLGKEVLDRGLLSKNHNRCGKVDDLLLEWDESNPTVGPIVCGILTGPMASAQEWPASIRWLTDRLYRLLGVHDPEPVEVPWERVDKIDVLVHLNIDRDDAGLNRLEAAISGAFIRPLPGA